MLMDHDERKERARQAVEKLLEEERREMRENPLPQSPFRFKLVDYRSLEEAIEHMGKERALLILNRVRRQSVRGNERMRMGREMLRMGKPPSGRPPSGS